MVQDGSVSYEVKNFLLKQKEVESVTIDQQHWDADGDGTATYPGQSTVGLCPGHLRVSDFQLTYSNFRKNFLVSS